MRRETFFTSTTQPLNNSWEARTWWGTTMRVQCCFLIVSASFGDVLLAQQITWRNDSLAEGQNGMVQAGFVNGDIGAAVFDVPCGFFPLQINSVQVFWRSQAEPTTQVMTHIHVYGGGAPDPGSPLFTAEGVVMTAGSLNEFSTSNLGWTLNQGPFTVGVEYVNDLEQPVNSLSGHLTTDADGCQPGKNLIFDVASAQWMDPCSVGMSGDFVIRIVFGSMGTGCFGDYDCDSHVDLGDVGAFQACFSGDGVAALLGCLPFDCDGDSDVDVTDYAALVGCLAGPEATCNPGCAVCVGGAGLANPNEHPFALLRSLVDSLQTAGFEGVPPAEFQAILSNGGVIAAPAFSLIQISIVIAIIAIITVFFVGPCWSASCRLGQSVLFRQQASNPDSTEQAKINQALDWLLQLHDFEADRASVWYDSHSARQSTLFGTIRVNHVVDRQGFVAQRILGESVVVVHVDFVTGFEFSPEILGLLLFAEWQHIDDPSLSERQAEDRLKAFRQRVGLTDIRPDIQHGWSEGFGG